jgi:hypothetical protein
MEYTHGNAQGWYSDPCRRHKARWFSDGTPTALVRDDGVESTDPPLKAQFTDKLEPAPETEGELLHGSVEHIDSSVDGVWDIFTSTGGD